MKVAFLFSPPWDPEFPSYAMALFKGSTKNEGHEFVGFDLNVDLYNAVSPDDRKLWDPAIACRWGTESDSIIRRHAEFLDSYIDSILQENADFYALSINVYSIHIALYVAQKIKTLAPCAKILFGGPQCFPSYSGLEILKHKCVDAICTGEGDVLWPKILRHFDKTGNFELSLPGICYRKADGSVMDNGVPELVVDLNSIPFADYSDIDFARYRIKRPLRFSIMTSRGCINTCAFCSERPNFYRYRHRKAENVFREIERHLQDLRNNPSISFLERAASRFFRLKRFVPYISFADSLINGVPRELERFCNLVIDSGLEFYWGGMALVRKEMSYDLLEKMKKAGCYNLAWGLETGSQEVLALMRKKLFDIELAKHVIKDAHRVGIKQAISLIVGFPGETEKMFRETADFVTEYEKYVDIAVQPMMVVKNSLVCDRPEEFGLESGCDVLKWETSDGTNTLDVRLQRVDALKEILGDKLRITEK